MAKQERGPGSRGTTHEAAAASVKALTQPHIETAIDLLVDVMRNGERDGPRLAAACKLLDLAGGKAGQARDDSPEDGDSGVDEILAQMHERARRLRPHNGPGHR